MFMGGELQSLQEVPAGNIVGIGGLANDIVKTATLSSTMYCTSFSELSIMATPILRVAIEPVHPLYMPKLIKGLKLLNQVISKFILKNIYTNYKFWHIFRLMLVFRSQWNQLVNMSLQPWVRCMWRNALEI